MCGTQEVIVCQEEPQFKYGVQLGGSDFKRGMDEPEKNLKKAGWWTVYEPIHMRNVVRTGRVEFEKTIFSGDIHKKKKQTTKFNCCCIE